LETRNYSKILAYDVRESKPNQTQYAWLCGLLPDPNVPAERTVQNKPNFNMGDVEEVDNPGRPEPPRRHR